MGTKVHPCQSCGACCTSYRVFFSASELRTDSFAVPAEMTYRTNPGELALKHKSQTNPRCLALEGHVGQFVNCGIYENRPSPCRKFEASYESGKHNPRCDESRIRRGMQPLTLEDWDFEVVEAEPIKANTRRSVFQGLTRLPGRENR